MDDPVSQVSPRGFGVGCRWYALQGGGYSSPFRTMYGVQIYRHANN